MLKWLKAISIAMQVLTAVESAVVGLPATLSIEWKGKTYKVVLTQS